MKFLSPDSGFMRGLSDAVDAIWINILMLVTSIPIITIGAALTAGHDAARRSLAGEGTVTRVSADSITVRYDSGESKDYKLIKFSRSNQGTCFNARSSRSASA